MTSAFDDPRVTPAMFTSNARRFGADDEQANGGIPAAGDEFDPGEYTVDDVKAYLDSLEDPVEYDRVIQAEFDGKARKGVTELNHPAPGSVDAEPIA